MRSASAPVRQITPRETEILEYLAEGYSGKEIAQKLGIAPTTVDRHVEHARLKFGARNRTHLVAVAIQHGVLVPEPAASPQ